MTAIAPARDRHLADRALVRAIRVRQLIAAIINTTIGAGIFVLPAVVASTLGAAASFAYLVCSLAMVLIILSFAAAGSRVSLTGGLNAYAEIAFGPFVGFLAGVLYWLAASFAVASVASALASSVGVVAPVFGVGLGRVVLLTIVLGALTWFNVRGVRVGAGIVELMTATKLLSLVVLVGSCGTGEVP